VLIEATAIATISLASWISSVNLGFRQDFSVANPFEPECCFVSLFLYDAQL
jgi:hypothetical protein